MISRGGPGKMFHVEQFDHERPLGLSQPAGVVDKCFTWNNFLLTDTELVRAHWRRLWQDDIAWRGWRKCSTWNNSVTRGLYGPFATHRAVLKCSTWNICVLTLSSGWICLGWAADQNKPALRTGDSLRYLPNPAPTSCDSSGVLGSNPQN